MTRKRLNYVGNADLVNKFFGMLTIHNKHVGMERPTLNELSLKKGLPLYATFNNNIKEIVIININKK